MHASLHLLNSNHKSIAFTVCRCEQLRAAWLCYQSVSWPLNNTHVSACNLAQRAAFIRFPTVGEWGGYACGGRVQVVGDRVAMILAHQLCYTTHHNAHHYTQHVTHTANATS